MSQLANGYASVRTLTLRGHGTAGMSVLQVTKRMHRKIAFHDNTYNLHEWRFYSIYLQSLAF
jgi:hypothetical protein